MHTNDSHPPELDWAQVARYFSGELPPGEARALEHWLGQDERSRRLLAEARAAWEASAVPRGAWVPDAEVGVRRLREAIAGGAVPAATAEVRRRMPALPWRERRVASPVRTALLAASLAALTVAGAVWLAQPWSGRRAGTGAGHSAHVAMNEVATARGQRATVMLPDGSHVTLGVASRLRYPRDFGLRSRTVSLEGEAYFDVAHDGAHPFRVRAGVGELEDIGTAFVVRAYDSTDVRVVVAEGSVMARRAVAPADRTVLTAAQLARIGARGIERRDSVPVRDYVAWMRGEIVFDDATLGAVAEELARWYDLDVRVDGPAVARRRFTGVFRGQAADAVVRAIAAAANVTAERTPGGWRFR